jgi:hypothetical protein
MARIFISHNSNDAKEAAALKRWLADNGWDDTFLDIHAKDGLSPGERWKDALKNAADRCEAVLCLISPLSNPAIHRICRPTGNGARSTGTAGRPPSASTSANSPPNTHSFRMAWCA